MKAKTRRGAARGTVTPPKPKRKWLLPAGILAILVIAIEAYGPVLYGPFLFDDQYLPFMSPTYPSALRAWVSGVRPLLMTTYWVNLQTSGTDPYPYHLLNILFHAMNAVLTFFIVRKILSLAGPAAARRDLVSAFCALLFLLHPVQTESVSYVASRSENQSLLFFLGAFALFLYRRRPAISWTVSTGVLILFGAALATKEHTFVLPALLLLSDYYWNPGFSFEGIRRNWRLYGPLAAGALGGALFIWKILAAAGSAGFGMKDLPWYQYFFTECRAFFVYLRLFIFPAGQTVDYDFPISRTLFDHGAIFGLLVILLLTAVALWFRRRFPLASYGFLAYLILMAPTSSFVPIRDPIAERRLYLPFLGLLLIAAEFLLRLRVERRAVAGTLAGLVLVAGVLTYQRNLLWADPVAFWQDTVNKSPRNARAHFQLGYAYFQQNRCDLAAQEYQKVAELQPPRYDLLVDWAHAYDCLNRPQDALAKLRQAAALEPSAHVYSQIGMIYGKQSRWADALNALAMAEKIDPNYATTYVYRGDVHISTNDAAAAAEDYRRALSIDPANSPARQGLIMAEQRLRRPAR